ncbi:MAG: potassium channel family protein [Acidimicrobiales bacterium]
MHVIVTGCGRVGSELAAVLANQGHTVAIIDKNPAAFRKLPPDWEGKRVVGSAFDRGRLEEAGIGEAAALAAVTSGDNSNVLTVRIARETYGVAHVAARIYDPRRAVIYQRLGIPTVATVSWSTDQVMRRLFPETAASDWSDATGQLLLVERMLPPHLVGHPLRAVEEGGRLRLAALTRHNRPVLGCGEPIGQEGDLLHLMVLEQDLGELEAILSKAGGS